MLIYHYINCKYIISLIINQCQMQQVYKIKANKNQTKSD